MSRKNTDSSKKNKDIVRKLIPGVLIAIMLISGYNTISAFINYRTANEEYDNLTDYVEPATEVTTEAESVTAEDEFEEEESKLPEIPQMDIDFEALTRINEDFRGWLMVPALDITYPVLQGSDNEQYLHETFEHKHNKAGAIFMDSYNYPDFRDFNTFIYGHNMRDGSMFGSLKTIGDHPELVEAEPYIYVYTPRASYQFQIVAYYTTRKGSDTYRFILKPEEYDAYLDYIGTVNEIAGFSDVDYSEYPKMLTLSTCKGAAGTSNRFVIHSVLVGKRKNE
jgi:sortase B